MLLFLTCPRMVLRLPNHFPPDPGNALNTTWVPTAALQPGLTALLFRVLPRVLLTHTTISGRVLLLYLQSKVYILVGNRTVVIPTPSTMMIFLSNQPVLDVVHLFPLCQPRRLRQ